MAVAALEDDKKPRKRKSPKKKPAKNKFKTKKKIRGNSGIFEGVGSIWKKVSPAGMMAGKLS
jgi:hypothetical protein